MGDGRFDLKKLGEALDPEHDELFKYIGVVTNKNRYALRKNSVRQLKLRSLRTCVLRWG
jgi:hypothetical protein